MYIVLCAPRYKQKLQNEEYVFYKVAHHYHDFSHEVSILDMQNKDAFCLKKQVQKKFCYLILLIMKGTFNHAIDDLAVKLYIPYNSLLQ